MIDEQILAKEQQVLGNMKLSELQGIDPSKSIIEPPGEKTGPGAQGEEGGLPGVGGQPDLGGAPPDMPDMPMP